MGPGPLNKNLKSSSIQTPIPTPIKFEVGIKDSNIDINDKKNDEMKDGNLNGSVDKKENGNGNEEKKLSSLSTQSETSSTIIQTDNVLFNQTVTIKYEAKDVKVDIKSMLDHSSGAALYEQLLSTESKCEYHTNDEIVSSCDEKDCDEDIEGEGKSEEGWHNYTPDSATLFQNDEDEDTWRNMDPDDAHVSTKESSSGPRTIAAPVPGSTFFSPSILKSISSSMFSSLIDNTSGISTTSDITTVDDSKTQSHDETATVATAVTFSTMDDIKELRAAKYRLNQQQEQDQKKQNP